MIERLHCLVPGCKRTHAPFADPILGDPVEAWICHSHWTAIPAGFRAHYAKLKRLFRRARQTNDERHVYDLGQAVSNRWKFLTRRAIEGAMGI